MFRLCLPRVTERSHVRGDAGRVLRLRPILETVLTSRWYAVPLLLAAISCAGCLSFSSAGVKQKMVSAQTAEDSRAKAEVTDKVVSSDRLSGGLDLEAAPGPPSHRKAYGRSATRPEDWRLSRKAGVKTNPAESERQKVKKVALELASNTASVDRIKICHDPKENEWWITLYADAGVFVELKQYIWSIYKDEPEPFLVQERVSKDRLEDHLSTAKSGMACEAFERSNDRSTDTKTVSEPAKPEAVMEGKSEGAPPAGSALAKGATSPLPAPRSSRPAAAKGAMRTGPVAPPGAPPKKKPVAPPARDDDERVYRLTSSGPIQSRSRIRTPPPSSPIDPNFRTASARSATLDVAPRAGVSRPADNKPSVDRLDANSRVKETSKSAQSQSGLPTYFVFIYGSEMNYQELMAWLESNGYDPSLLVDATPAVLEGYDFVWNYYSPSRRGGAVNLEPKRNSKIWGLLIECEDRLLEAFDRKEGHPNYYSRGEKRAPVHDAATGKTVFAWVYLARPNKGERRDIWPTRDYKSRVLDAALFWDFPEDYVRKIRDWPTR